MLLSDEYLVEGRRGALCVMLWRSSAGLWEYECERSDRTIYDGKGFGDLSIVIRMAPE